jgi:hypothetical protein
MTSEEIIQRLLDEKKISASEALIILKDLARIGMTVISDEIIPDSWKGTATKPNPYNATVVMYGVTPTIYDNNNSNVD